MFSQNVKHCSTDVRMCHKCIANTYFTYDVITDIYLFFFINYIDNYAGNKILRFLFLEVLFFLSYV